MIRLPLLLALAAILHAQANNSTLANGVYAVLREAPTRDQAAAPAKTPNVTLLYDQNYSDTTPKPAPRYVTLDTSSFVPLILAKDPELAGEYRGHPMLQVTLAPGQAKALENFTRAHLGDTIAVVVDREIVTIHKVRAVIEGGLVQISRCDDDACRILRLKLAKE